MKSLQIVPINELICLSNMENINAVFIDQGISQGERLIRLNQIAIQQIKVLEDGQEEIAWKISDKICYKKGIFAYYKWKETQKVLFSSRQALPKRVKE